MDENELLELASQVEGIHTHDFRLGRVLRQLVLHLGHAHGLDLPTEEAQAQADKAKAAEEAAVPKAVLSSDTDKRAATSAQGDK